RTSCTGVCVYIRIVLLVITGGGKSSAGNTIFGQDDVFLVDSSSTSSTQKCKAHTKNIKGRNITLIDTPGFFDTDIPEEELKPKIVKCITECAPGPHAFLIVLKVERYTVHENEAVAKIETYFSPEAFKYATVLFTHGDQQNAELNKPVEKCGGCYHVIDNKYWNTNQQGRYRNNQYQVVELLNTIEKMVRENRGGFYTNEMLQEAERLIQAEIEDLRKESTGQMSEKEMGKQAKEIVRNKVLIKLSGTLTGVGMHSCRSCLWDVHNNRSSQRRVRRSYCSRGGRDSTGDAFRFRFQVQFSKSVPFLACQSWWGKQTKNCFDACQQSHDTTLKNRLIAL
uniref:AIG1-type G domain-containing protein n=1 Tax=Oncorhynchus mykiss TaxID=8022 RepID=A0A8K9WZZ9_ONCMY